LIKLVEIKEPEFLNCLSTKSYEKILMMMIIRQENNGDLNGRTPSNEYSRNVPALDLGLYPLTARRSRTSMKVSKA
jgi:hypothetical protein